MIPPDVQKRLQEGELRELFLEDLGWDHPSLSSIEASLDERAYSVEPIAQKAGFHVLRIECDGEIPAASTRLRLDRVLSAQIAERLLVFVAGNEMVWLWPEHRKGGGTRLIAHTYRIGQEGTALVQRLAAIEFDLADEDQGLTLSDVRARVRANFNAEAVTKKFYERFEIRHGDLLKAIEGVDISEDRRWYASVLMNRLMFVWFLQKKGFLNNDDRYLRTCLDRIRRLRGPDRFYSFYREVLIPMFHDGFGAPENARATLEPEIVEIIGDVPYINGGLFEPHPIELESDIRIRDEEFERIFDFFDGFAWHLDDRATGRENEVNPDVIGYIFERYINFTASGRKANGAYYTKEDVTSYMLAGTLVPYLIRRIVDVAGVDISALVADRPQRYVKEGLSYGRDPIAGTWRPPPDAVAGAWRDVHDWPSLDESEVDPRMALPGEGWVEALDRRRRVDALCEYLASGTARLEDLPTQNVDLRQVMLDAIDAIEDPEHVARVWDAVTAVRVLDPTCGSGAFLFAALDVLDETYEHLLLAARRVGEGGSGSAVESLVERFATVEGERYAVRKHAALNNLYGVDIMPEAIEIAKLRLFLALAATLETREQITALPDLDFNLRSGNLLVGFRDDRDAEERFGTVDLLAGAQVRGLLDGIKELTNKRNEFVAAQAAGTGLGKAKAALRASSESISEQADHIYATASGGGADVDAWTAAHTPFHWFVEFPEVFEHGGFDVVVGNPPYVAMAESEHPLLGFATEGAHDLYLPCLERSLGLVAPEGCYAMVVPHSICFRGGHASAVRGLVQGRFGTVLASSYAKRPDSLFSGVQVRNAIVIGLSWGEGRTFVSRHMVWTTAARAWMLETLRYTEVDRALGEWARVPAPSIAHAFLSQGDTGLSPRRKETGAHHLFFRRTSQYWVPVLADEIPIYTAELERQENPNLSTLRFDSATERLVALGVLAGKLGYLWWSMFGDDFNVTAETLRSAVDAVGGGLRPSPELGELLVRLDKDMQSGDHRMWTMNRYWVGNVDLLGLRDLTDQIDERILAERGLAPEVWADVQVWYRQAMRATRRANNAVFAALPPGVLAP